MTTPTPPPLPIGNDAVNERGLIFYFEEDKTILDDPEEEDGKGGYYNRDVTLRVDDVDPPLHICTHVFMA